MMCVRGHRAAIANKRLWQTAILTAAGAIAVASHAEAALYYWSDSEPGVSRPDPAAETRRPKARHHVEKKTDASQRESAKPQGPVIISISIDQQKLRLYDANGLYAESPVSTGMRGHPTPMGVFSVIQKQKLHHSNIYSGAPMPFMQRITWSGIAIHAGVLPGYPASHGCIRMPMAFAMKMWNWTKMGARVVVTPGEMTPASFSHPLLVAQKVTPQPAVADEAIKNDLPKADMPAVKSDKGADAGSAIESENSKSANLVASLELRSTVGHASPLRTADASGAMPSTNAAVTMSDATTGKPSSSEAVSAEAKPEASESRPEAESTSAKSADAVSSDNKSAEASATDAKSDETGSVEKKAEEAQAPTPAAPDTAKTETASDSAKVQEKAEDKPAEAKVEVKAEPTPVEATKPEVTKVDEPKATETKAVETKAVEKPAEPAKATADAPADVKKDTARLPAVEKAAKIDPKRGQIAVFVSRKDSKLYVRQNFAPLFDVPVTIAPSDRALGTHVFTAEADKSDPNLLRWSVVTLPVTARNAARNDDDDRSARRRKSAASPAEVKSLPAPDSPAEALDRITIPQDAMVRIAEALTTGGSIIVSDQGINQGETGEGTDFIVSLR
jgi:lipoprotein-anchoring transpeptidase ErfK/SrfK